MLISELKAGTDTEQLKEVQIKWQLSDQPSPEDYFDAMLERAQCKITAERKDLHRELGFIDHNTPKMGYPSR